MKPIVKFYATVLSYLQSDIEDSNIVKQIIELAQKANPSWETNEKSVANLELCVNRGSTVSDEDLEFTTRNDFAKAAFRDLSVIRDDQAMVLFGKIANTCVPSYAAGDDLLVWARSIRRRDDGSAVIVLHVSDLQRFRDIIENHNLVDNSTEHVNLEETVQIGS